MRPMALVSHQVLYVGTHQGRVQRVTLPGPWQPERWEQLWENGRREALMCLAVSTLNWCSATLFLRWIKGSGLNGGTSKGLWPCALCRSVIQSRAMDLPAQNAALRLPSMTFC